MKEWKKVRTMNVRLVAACAFAMTFVGQAIDAQDLSRYRTFELGATVATVSALTGVEASEATMVHRRPVLLQTLEWTPSRWIPGTSAESTDPVDRVGFSFCDDRLFMIVVDYGQDRTEGLTTADMIDAISTAYGPGVASGRRPARIQSQIESESGSPVARWGDAKRSIVLYRTSSYRESYRLIVIDTSLADRARKGENEALRLDDQEAPRREVARQKKERDDARAAADKARTANKGLFKP